MMTQRFRRWQQRSSLIIAFLLVVSPLFANISRADGSTSTAPEAGESNPAVALSQILRLERIEVPGGAELITVHAKLDGLESNNNDKWIPLVSILRDTLGDNTVENNRLRYVWPLTYTRPSLKQRLAAAIPFFYVRVGNKNKTTKTPPPALDLASPESEVWNKLFWTALQNVLLDPYGTPIKASTSTYRRNTSDYRKSHIIRALSVLALYQEVQGESAFSPSEMATIQGRLMLTDKTFGGLVDDSNLPDYYARKTAQTRDARGHNWELLRQRAEAESLYFEPLVMPDGSATHAFIWVAKRDLLKQQGARFSSRFLNIANPWTDKRLLQWDGYVETRYFDADNQPVSSDTPGAQAVEMIPLGLYGLDNPKIPMLLVDFRDNYNPKKREMSRRVLNDVTRNVLSVSKFGSLPYFLGRTVFDFVTGRRGMDFNQPSRLQTYSQLKLLLALNNSMAPELRSEVSGRLEKISLNPFENGINAEANIALEQYAALLAYAKDPKGLAAQIERDRREEMMPLDHGPKAQLAFRVLNILTFGKYVHREELTVDLEDRLDVARRLQYHTRFLEQIAKSSAEVDITWNLDDVKTSLRFIATHGAQADSSAAAATARIFARTRDDETRRTCLDSLSRIRSNKARNELLRISQNNDVDQTLRDLANEYLRDGNRRTEPIAVTVTSQRIPVGQP
ncbi:MAG TPA: hypothetical protein VJT15_25745 [Pyrinomonadaceae bacterium]|nr:hypothetical protein [Pyrinomonadaceae bacterium]